MLERPAWTEFGAAAALGGPEFLDLRVTQLETGHEPRFGPLPRLGLAATVVGVAAMGAAFVLTLTGSATDVGMMGGSAPMGDSTLFGVLGGIGCATAWIAAGWLVWRRYGMRHKRLTSSEPT